MRVTEVETTARSKRDLCDKLVDSLNLCDTLQDVTTWLVETEEERNEIKKDEHYKAYLYDNYLAQKEIIKLKSENKWRI